MKARAYVNIALTKYWGKKDEMLHLPFYSTISYTLDAFYTETEVIKDDNLNHHVLYINQQRIEGKAKERVDAFIEVLKKKYHINGYFRIISENYVPMSVGLASSASSFAALSKAFVLENNIVISNQELSTLARRGSGSATRSVFGGFVAWLEGDDKTSYAKKLNVHWPEFKMIIIQVNENAKMIGSREAMSYTVKHASDYPRFVENSRLDFNKMVRAVMKKSLTEVGLTAERNARRMHRLIESVGITYLSNESKAVFNLAKSLRENGIPVYATADAGNTICFITEEKYVNEITKHIAYPYVVTKEGRDCHEVND